MDKDVVRLAEELREFLPTPSLPSMEVQIRADEESGCIECAPADMPHSHIHYVEEIVLFAKYHGLSVITTACPSGGGLELF